MVSRRNKTLASLSLVLAIWAWSASAAAAKGETAAVDVSSLTSPQIEDQLQVINQGRVPTTNVSSSPLPELLARPGPQCTQSCFGRVSRLKPDVQDLRFSVSWQSRCQCPPRDLVHLRAAQLSARTMPTQHRSLVAVRHGGLCCRRAVRRHTLPSTA